MSDRLNWGLIGCGLITADFVTSLRLANMEHKIVAVASSSQESAVEFLSKLELSDAKPYGDFADLLADQNIEVVYIGLFNDAHITWVLKAIEAGKHILCEKPLAINTKQVRLLASKANQKNVFVMEAMWSRFFPVWQSVKAMIDDDQLGPLRTVHMTLGGRLPQRRRDLTKGECPLLNMGIYLVAMTLFVFDDRKPSSLSAVGGRDERGVDTWGSITMVYPQAHAVLYYNGDHELLNSAVLTFDKGRVVIPDFFWCPTEYSVISADTNIDEKKRKNTIDHTIQDNPEKYNFCNSAGLYYQADHVHKMIKAGNTVSPVMNLKASILLAEVLESVRKSMGISFPQDS